MTMMKNASATTAMVLNNGKFGTCTLATCPICGKDFFKTNGHQRYCSPECAKKVSNALNAERQRKKYAAAKAERLANSVGVEVRPYLHHSNFASIQERTQRMLILRKQGYSNARIAKAVGASYSLVLKSIGTQPSYITDSSFKIAGIKRKAISTDKKVAVKLNKGADKYDQICNQASDLVVKMEKMKEKIARLQAQAAKHVDEYAKVNDLDLNNARTCEACGRLFVPVHHKNCICPSCKPKRNTIAQARKVSKSILAAIDATGHILS